MGPARVSVAGPEKYFNANGRLNNYDDWAGI
jgi:hypothetical protein